MLEFSPHTLLSIVATSGAEPDAELLVGFSGGLDSTVLLYALAEALAARRTRLRAVHIHHGLHPDADQWERHCAAVAQTLGVKFQSHRIHVPDAPTTGIEAAARSARYDVFRELLSAGAVLLTAHHADDQLETVLLALTRGAGVDGLAAMPSTQRFGRGWHLRPLLEFTREQLRSWATTRALHWLEDPSNANPRFDRNYVRQSVAPALRARWPSIAHSVSRTAKHLGEAKTLLDDLAAHDFAAAARGPCLKLSALAALSSARRRNLLRYWIRSCGARVPSTRKLVALEHDMIAAEEDRNPVVTWEGFQMRRYRGLLYCEPELPAEARRPPLEWEWGTPLDLHGAGALRAEIAQGCGLAVSKTPARLSVRTRSGGESIRLPGQPHHRTLKNLLNEANVLPWWRDRVPLVFVGDALAAVADIWVAAEFATGANERGVQIHWERRPRIHAIAASD